MPILRKSCCNDGGIMMNHLYKECSYVNIIEDNSERMQRYRYWGKRISLWTFKISLLVFCIIFILGPVIYKYSYAIQRRLVFLNFVNWPKNPDYSQPSLYGSNLTRNFYLTTDQGVRLGVWHVLPEAYMNLTSLLNGGTNKTTVGSDQEDQIVASSSSSSIGTFYEEKLMNDGRDVIMYNHGNSGSRVSSHRIELYQVLRKKFHVVAFDYRSYGDSDDTYEPTEAGLVADTIFMYRWLASHTKGRIFVWGHSLGTGVSTHMLGRMYHDIEVEEQEGTNKNTNKARMPHGLVLESPFTNFIDEISEHPLAKLFRPLPWFHYTIIDPMQQNNFIFASDKHIIKVDCPVLILHAEDDGVVPYKLGEKLYKTALDFRRSEQGSVYMHTFKAELEFGHKYICRSPDILNIVMNFTNDAIKETEQKHLV